MVGNVPKSSVNVNFFFFDRLTSSGTFSSFLSQLLSIFTSILSSLSSSSCVTSSLNWQKCQYSHGQLLLLSLCLCSVWMSLPAVLLFFLHCTFIFVNQLTFLTFNFLKMPLGFITRRKGGNMATHFAMNWRMCSDQSLTDFERSDMIHQWSWCLYVMHMVICGLKSFAGKFVVYADTHSWNWNVSCIVRILVLFS